MLLAATETHVLQCLACTSGNCRQVHVACCANCSVAPGETVRNYMLPYHPPLWSALGASVEEQRAVVGESARLILELAEVSPAADV